MRYLNHDDDRSEVSSLRCGSVPPNPNYVLEQDPFYLNQPFVAPTEIDIPTHKTKGIEIPVKVVVEKRDGRCTISSITTGMVTITRR